MAAARDAPVVLGPPVSLVDTVAFDDAEALPGGVAGLLKDRLTPLLVTGLVHQWPLYDRWSFDRLARLKRPNGSALEARFRCGLVEQGRTQAPLYLPVSPYLQDLGEASRALADAKPVATRGLMPAERYAALAAAASRDAIGSPSVVASSTAAFHLNFEYLETFSPTRVYLADWHILHDAPSLRRDIAPVRAMWPWSGRVEHSLWVGPSFTVSGLHMHPSKDVLSCQVRGIKEWLLFGPEHSDKLRPSAKFSPDAVNSAIDITRLAALPVPQLRALERCFGGQYARLSPGDALYVPAGTWHAAVGLTPSISLNSSCHLPAAGGPCARLSQFARVAAHNAGYYRRDGCTCHAADHPATQGRPPVDALPAVPSSPMKGKAGRHDGQQRKSPRGRARRDDDEAEEEEEVQ